MKNIEINKDWLYHQIDPYSLKSIAKKGGVLSYRMQGKRKKLSSLSYNGNDYISLAKKMETGTELSCYKRFIINHYALIFDCIDAEKPILTEDLFNFFAFISKFNLVKNRTCFMDEYQVKNGISLSKAIGIKIPEKEFDFIPVPTFYSQTDKEKGIDSILSSYDEFKLDLPFIDVEEGKN